jgi:SsrA-binding protein
VLTFVSLFTAVASNEINIKNKRARFEYFIDEEFIAGIVLSGTEIKSIRNGKASIIESYCVIAEGELFIRNMYIAPYENASFYTHKTRGDRKLLLNKKELNRIDKFLKVKGNTIVPLKLFLSEKGWLKVQIACARGKKLHDKREDLKEKDDRREMDRAMKR